MGNRTSLWRQTPRGNLELYTSDGRRALVFHRRGVFEWMVAGAGRPVYSQRGYFDLADALEDALAAAEGGNDE